MTTATYSTTLAYVDHTCGAVRPHHAAIMAAISNGGALDADLADLLILTKAPLLNADGSARWLIDWA